MKSDSPLSAPDPDPDPEPEPEPGHGGESDRGRARSDLDITPEALSELSDAEIASQLTTWAGRIAAGEARLLAYIGEFDERRAWAGVGMLSCAMWLSWRIGMGAKAAFERVRVARALRELPLTFTAFAEGRLSFTQVRAITRMATPADEQTYVQLARHASGQQLERLARGIRRARSLADSTGQQATAPRPHMRVRHDEDGTVRVTLRASAADAAVLIAAVEAAQSDLDIARSQEETQSSAEEKRAESSAEDSEPRRATEGDAVLHVCKTYLRRRAQSHPDRAGRDRARLVAQVDPVSGWARLPNNELIPPEVAAAERLTLPAGVTLRRLQPSDLTRYDGGRQRREVDQPLRELLAAVDGERCRFPGCSRHRRLHAHHVVPWSAGGPTDLANLVLVCSRHHTLVHTGSFVLRLDPTTRALVVTSKDGTTIPHHPPLPHRPPDGLDVLDQLDNPKRINAETITPDARDRLNLHHAVSVLLQHAA